MTEFYEHNPGDHDDPLPGPTWLIGFISVVLLVVIFLGLTALYYGAEEEEADELNRTGTVLDLETINRGQVARIEGPARWEQTVIDGAVADRRLVIPVDLAMQRIVEETPAAGR